MTFEGVNSLRNVVMQCVSYDDDEDDDDDEKKKNNNNKQTSKQQQHLFSQTRYTLEIKKQRILRRAARRAHAYQSWLSKSK